MSVMVIAHCKVLIYMLFSQGCPAQDMNVAPAAELAAMEARSREAGALKREYIAQVLHP